MKPLDITHMVLSDIDEMPLLSGSAFELGDNAGQITWRNSLNYAAKNPLLNTPEEIEEARDYFGSFGAWNEEERGAWSAAEVQSLVVQHIAANIREMERFDTYEEYEIAANDGRCSGDIYRGDDGRYYASLNH